MTAAQAHPPRRPRSHAVTEGIEATAARGMLRGLGVSENELGLPQVGIGSPWNQVTPCNENLDRLAQAAADGVRSAKGLPFRFGTISVSDGIAMGHEGMNYSLVSREVIGQRRDGCGGRTVRCERTAGRVRQVSAGRDDGRSKAGSCLGVRVRRHLITRTRHHDRRHRP